MILETSWEVCNKIGGIYTVLSTRARQMTEIHGEKVIFLGPYHTDEDSLPDDFIPECPTMLKEWMGKKACTLKTPVIAGRWDVPGKPAAILIDFKSIWEDKASIYFQIWEKYGIQPEKGYGDYDETSLFSVAAARVMHSLYNYLHQSYPEKWIAIFNEWQTAMGLLYTKKHCPYLGTMFITHATTVGRSIAGNGKALYAYMDKYNGDQMAQELNVEAKHAVEKKAAHEADCFSSVSDLTAIECEQLLDKIPDVITPNGFEPDFVPQGADYTKKRNLARKNLLDVTNRLTGCKIDEKNAFFIALGGRYEYRNKGIDVYLDALNRYKEKYDGEKQVIAFVLVPGWVAEPRADLKYLITNKRRPYAEPLQYPVLTHWLHEMDKDKVINQLSRLGINNLSENKLKVFFVPCYLNGQDGIFNETYYDLLIGADLTVFPSYYEPWGYTPLESIAFGIPTITTNLSGFGLWAIKEKETHAEKALTNAVQVVERKDFEESLSVETIADHIHNYVSGIYGTPQKLREESQRFAGCAEWKKFYTHYQKAYDLINNRRNERKNEGIK